MLFKIAKCPSDTLALFNCVIVAPGDARLEGFRYIKVCPDHHKAGYPFQIKADKSMEAGQLGFTFHQRKWAELALNKDVEVFPYDPTADPYPYISTVKLEVDLLAKKGKAPTEAFDANEMAKAFTDAYPQMVLSVGQILVFDFRSINLVVTVKALEVLSLEKLQAVATSESPEDTSAGGETGHKGTTGLLMSQSQVLFDKAENSQLNIAGTAEGSKRTALINPDWNFNDLGIGGLDKEFSAIFRRAFASRVFPPDLVKKLGINHVRGILLYGPPGTGKTLMARQIGKMLNAAEPKIVNGPEILDKYVGASEENIRKLFRDAEAEQAAKGEYSQLHIIIFDEIDAICKQRGRGTDSTGVHDTVVNQLLSKMDGVDQLNNILIIGMTNRRDMIDEALLRPGRLEVQMEINLPDEGGRLQILNIHTANMRDNKLMDDTVDLQILAANTKNFSGAEIAGLVKSASSFAFNRLINANNLSQVNEKELKNLKVTMDDFQYALDEVKPAFGVAEDTFAHCLSNGIINWGGDVQRILDDGKLFVEQVRNSQRTHLVSVLFEGAPGAGKTALAATVAMHSDYPFIKLITPDDYVGMSDIAKCNAIAKVFDDAYKSPLSIVVIDNIERLLEYVAIGPRFSNNVLQTLLVLLNKMPKHQRRLLILATTSQKQVLREMGMLDAFNAHVNVSVMTTTEHIQNVLEELDLFTPDEMANVLTSLKESPVALTVGVKEVLMLAEMARQDEANKVEKFLMSLRQVSKKNQSPY